jgi:hypothetical protein
MCHSTNIWGWQQQIKRRLSSGNDCYHLVQNLTLLTSGSRSVDIVRLRDWGHGVFSFFFQENVGREPCNRSWSFTHSFQILIHNHLIIWHHVSDATKEILLNKPGFNTLKCIENHYWITLLPCHQMVRPFSGLPCHKFVIRNLVAKDFKSHKQNIITYVPWEMTS